MVKALTDGGDANTKSCSLLPGDLFAEFGMDAGFSLDVFGEGAVRVVCRVA